MLAMALERIGALWPKATLEVFTNRPDHLLRYFPHIQPLPSSDRFLDRFDALTPRKKEALLRRAPALALMLWRAKRIWRRNRSNARDSDYFQRKVREADLVMACGGGYITDAFACHGELVLDTLAAAVRMGKPTALMGQGIGPIGSSELYEKARVTLPQVDLIVLREQRLAPGLLDALGVPSEIRMVTGDDAIECAYRERRNEIGSGIGVNLRRAFYSQIGEYEVEAVGKVLQEAARRHSALLLPVPIAVSENEHDPEIIRRLVGNSGAAPAGQTTLHTFLDVIRQVGHCRVVVTGSYHAGVFALAQGIPAVCLAKSDYYLNKFYGLSDQFGYGCEVLPLDGGPLEERLSEAIDRLWKDAGRSRASLLAAACVQIEAGRHAYQRLFDLVSSSRPRAK